MKNEMYIPDVVDFAHQVLDMDHELHNLRAEVMRLREVEQRYNVFLRESIQSGQQQVAGWLELLTSGRLEIKDAPK